MNNGVYEVILSCVSNTIFNTDKAIKTNVNISDLFKESAMQTVLPIVYTAMENSGYDVAKYEPDFYKRVVKSIKIKQQHSQLHKLLHSEDIPYVILKGCASAEYYPEPLLRTMGDVDFLVKEKDVEKAIGVLLENGYTTDRDFSGIHITFKNPQSGITLELHRQINGVPQGETGDKINRLFSNVIEDAVLKNGEYYIPNAFHHGLILLLHTASHLTGEGIGLRHLCDWAVFAASFTDDEFKAMFEEHLRDIGLWKFASLLTLCSVKYLGCPYKTWAGQADDEILQGIVEDIFSGGNFGKKDFSRYQHIKYISHPTHRTIDEKNVISQIFYATSTKAKKEYKFVRKIRVLLPVGCFLVVFKYFGFIILGKRKIDNRKMIKYANKRKRLYKEFELFIK